MRFLLVIGAIALTVLSWGLYGPVLHHGIKGMGGGRLLPFFFVGVAYFFIAVAVPGAWLRTRGEAGSWTVGGSFWSLMAGAAGALGALGLRVLYRLAIHETACLRTSCTCGVVRSCPFCCDRTPPTPSRPCSRSSGWSVHCDPSFVCRGRLPSSLSLRSACNGGSARKGVQHLLRNAM